MQISTTTTTSTDQLGSTAPEPASTPVTKTVDSQTQSAASTVVSLSGEARQRLAEELQKNLVSPPETASAQGQMSARQRKLMEKLLKRTSLLEMDVFSEMREKVKAQLQRKVTLPPAQRQAADDKLLKQQQDATPSSPN